MNNYDNNLIKLPNQYHKIAYSILTNLMPTIILMTMVH